MSDEERMIRLFKEWEKEFVTDFPEIGRVITNARMFLISAYEGGYDRAIKDLSELLEGPVGKKLLGMLEVKEKA